MPSKLTTEEFIQRAQKVQAEKGRRYDYSLVDYKNNRTKVKIICPEHGVFEQTPYNHVIKKNGCPRCGALSRQQKRKKNSVDFIKQSEEIHNNKYSYKLVEYENAFIKVKIVCPEHGVFEQRPNDHLNGHGCPKCGIKLSKDKQRATTEEFIQRAQKVQAEKRRQYDYSLVEYKNRKTKVKIICPEHGVFEQIAEVHLNGFGCPKCSGQFMDTKYFIQKAQEIHQMKYDYSKVNYVNKNTKVEIICPVHGSFKQWPGGHLQGVGCPECAKTGFNPNKPAVLYYFKDCKTGLYKIGITNGNLYSRYNKNFCEKRNIELLKEIYYEIGQDAYNKEQQLLEEFNQYRTINEDWPDEKGGKTEFFFENVLDFI